jgi:hypothetical protein
MIQASRWLISGVDEPSLLTLAGAFAQQAPYPVELQGIVATYQALGRAKPWMRPG